MGTRLNTRNSGFSIVGETINKLARSIVTVLLLVSCFNCLAQKKMIVQKPFEQATLLFDQYNYSGCIELIKSDTDLANSSSPYYFYSRILLGMAFLENREFRNSATTLGHILHDENYIDQTPEQYVNGYLSLANTYRYLSKPDSAQYYIEKCKELLDGIDDQNLYARYLFEKGRNSVDGDSALNYYSKALESFDTTDNKILELYTHLAEQLETNDPDSGMYFLDKGKALQRSIFPDDTLGLVGLYLQEGYQLYRIGKLKESERIYEEILRPLIFKNHHINRRRYQFESTIFYRLALITHNYTGKYSKCIMYGQKFLEIRPLFNDLDHFRFGEVYRDLANTYFKLGRYATYLEYTDRATAILSLKDSYYKSNLVYKAKSSLVSQKFEQCIAYCDTLLNYEQSIAEFTWRSREAGYYKLICLSKLGRLKELSEFTDWINTKLISELNYDFNKILKYRIFAFAALEQERKALNRPDLMDSNDSLRISMVNIKLDSLYSITIPKLLLDEDKKPLEAIGLLNLYGYDQMLKDNLDSASYILDKAIQFNTRPQLAMGKIPDLDEVRRYTELVESLWIKGLNNKKRYDKTHDILFLKKSLEFLLQCDKFNEEENKKLGSIEDKIHQIRSYFDSGINEELMYTIYELWKLEKNDKYLTYAMRQMEKRKSYVLLESLQKKEAQHATMLPDSLFLKESSLNEQVSYLENKIKGYDKNSRSRLLSQFRHSLSIAKQEQEQLEDYLEKQYPQYYEIKYDLDLITVADVQQNLNSNEALLHYYTGEEYNFVLAISSKRVLFEKLDTLGIVTVRKFRNSLQPNIIQIVSQQHRSEYAQYAYQIYQSQLEPILKSLEGIDKLYIIPDGNLHHIPFEALITSMPKAGENDFKILDYLIKRYTLSYGYSASTLFKYNSLLSLFESRESKVLAFAPQYAVNEQYQPYGSIRSELNELKWNDDEINGIRNYFDGEYLYGADAIEQHFQANASHYDILHLSMHAIVNHEEPMYSHLSFTRNHESDSLYDGSLYAFELYGMKLNARLAVLSGCNTGYGKLFVGEGAMSLAKAFRYAGCQSIVMSHWPAEDQSSSQIMISFYEYLGEGMPKDQALRNAKLDFLENSSPLYHHPYYWNNFVITGDVSPLVKNRTNLYIVIGLFAFVLLLGIAYLIRGRLRQKLV